MVVNGIGVALLLLLVGDFLATFAYHVPEHVFGQLHNRVHHSSDRSFIRYALLHRQPIALVNGFLSAAPYLAPVPWLWQLSPEGVLLGLGLAELHVIWRHRLEAGHNTPDGLQHLCQLICLTTPERHWQHHCNAKAAFGDIFTFYGPPARWWWGFLMRLKKYLRQQRRSSLA
ncbi:sterol desaturase [filamentous cyanobacterium CCP5]|nr:sterol desaturase [filamentous cyanobacterium CCP5]